MFEATLHKDVLPVGRCSYDLPQPIADWMEKRQKEAVSLPSGNAELLQMAACRRSVRSYRLNHRNSFARRDARRLPTKNSYLKIQCNSQRGQK